MTVTLLLIGILGLITALAAQWKGYNPALWFVFGAGLAIVALPMALLMKPNAQTRRQCPACREWIDREARVCARCGRDVFELLAAQPS